MYHKYNKKNVIAKTNTDEDLLLLFVRCMTYTYTLFTKYVNSQNTKAFRLSALVDVNHLTIRTKRVSQNQRSAESKILKAREPQAFLLVLYVMNYSANWG